MIASLEGVVAVIGDNYVIVTVGGVGLRVYVLENVIHGLGGVGDHIRLYTHLHVRENDLTLYGCSTQDELEIFRLLLGVSGIGPKIALAILSTLSPQSLRAAVAQEQADVLARAPGLGLKTARRVIFQLKDKMAPEGVGAAPALTDQDAEVIAALTALGYSIVEAQTALQSLPRDAALSLEERIRAALAYFS